MSWHTSQLLLLIVQIEVGFVRAPELVISVPDHKALPF